MSISKTYRNNFETLLRAAANKDLALMECHDAKTRRPVYTVCAMQREKNGDVSAVPLAKLFDGNPYEELLPPQLGEPDTPAAPVRKPYTVLLLRPDYARNHDNDTLMLTVFAENPEAALAQAREDAIAADYSNPDDREDFDDCHDATDYECLLLIEGEHRDINPEM